MHDAANEEVVLGKREQPTMHLTDEQCLRAEARPNWG